MIRRIGTSARGNAGAVSRLGDGSRVSSAAPWWLSGGISEADVAGVWQPKDSASLAASYLRLAGDEGYPNIDPLETGIGVAPNRAADGSWEFDGIAKFLSSGLQIPTGTADNYTTLIRFADSATTILRHLFGARTSSSATTYYIAPYLSSRVYFVNQNKNILDGAAKSSGVYGMAGKTAYYDGVSLGDIPVTGTGTTPEIFIGGSNDGSGAVYAPINAKVIAFGVWSSKLTSAQALAVSTAMAAL